MPESNFESAPTESFLVESFTAFTLALYRLNSSLIKKSSYKASKRGLLSALCPEAIAAHHPQGDGQGLLIPNGQHLVQTEGRSFTCCEA
jgi:hypothetical protein